MFRKLLARLHDDTRADVPIGTILVVAFIVVPLVVILILFKDELLDLFNDQADQVLDAGKENAKPSR
jgi:Na+-driven multidrug efflux pump